MRAGCIPTLAEVQESDIAMGLCKYCNEDAGWMQDSHTACYNAAHAAGLKPDEKLRARAVEVPSTAASTRGPLTADGVFWAVFAALCLWSLLSALVVAIVKA